MSNFFIINNFFAVKKKSYVGFKIMILYKRIGFLVVPVESSSDDDNEDACDCLPACNELTFEMSAVSQPRNWTFNKEEYGIYTNSTGIP